MDMKVAIGERIAKLRKAKKLSQQKFAYEAEIERSYLTHVEKGRKNIRGKRVITYHILHYLLLPLHL